MSDFRTAKRTISGNSEITLSRQTLRIAGTVTTVADNVLTTILSYTPSVNVNLIRIAAGGDDYAKFEMFIDAVRLETRRSAPQRFVDFSWAMPMALDAFETLEIKVTHFFVGETLDFESTLYGFPQPS